jgi:hypothetical protein
MIETCAVGNYGLHEESNDNGIIGLASALNMVIRSTMSTFIHKKILGNLEVPRWHNK